MSVTTLNPTTAVRGSPNLAWRAVIAVLVLAANKFLLNFFVDFGAAQAATTGLGADIRIAQHWGFRFLVTFAAGIALFGYVQGNARLRFINAAARSEKFRPAWLLVHLALFAPLAVISYSVYGNHGLQVGTPILALLWLAIAAASFMALLFGLAPWSTWRAACGALGVLWLYAAAIGIIAAGAMQWSQMLWAPTTQITFELVERVLRPLIPALQADPVTQVLDTGRFAVQISYLCSGLEGAGLLLAFCSAWLLYFRKEYYFPRALLLIPVGLGILFILNILRIAALVLIGDAGYPEVAIYGFHSQAGWIAFNVTACGIAYASRRSTWLNRSAQAASPSQVHNPTAAYLMPFLTILATGMLSRAASSGFETWYALRFFAGAVVIWFFWEKLRALDFRFTWRSAAVGLIVFAIWMLGAHFLTSRTPMPNDLAMMSPLARALWISTRLLASLITVPIAEELAFRGYLMRRVKDRDFESVRFADCGLWALLVSSALFGLGHGSMWALGVAAGVMYGLLVKRTGRIGEAIAAHAVTNGLIAVAVLAAGQWQLW
jgi:exosortase E/protease (VPEID-CTERM system)